MERTLSPDEKIRKAEEIYYRRKLQDQYKKSTKVNVLDNKKSFGILKKMILQIMICVLIYIIFYMIQNTNYIFSEDVIRKTREILAYDINVSNLYYQAKDYINLFIGEKIDLNKYEQNNILEEEIKKETDNNLEEKNAEEIETNEVSANENIGGESVEIEKEPVVLTQMEQDAKDILKTKSLIIPLRGTITSRYGLRNPETPTVPKNHTGIDIAVNEGTIFIAAMSGTVQEVSSKR